MERTVSDLLNQQNKKELALQIPQVKKRKMPVVDVLFPSHSLVLASQGYGKMVVQADPSIPFGTFGRPLVSSQSIATIEYSDTTGLWTATAIETTNTCVPTMEVNVPNIPLTSFKPIVDSSIILEPFRVDTNFAPHVGPMGQITLSSKMPPQILPPGTTGGGGMDRTPLEVSQTPYLPNTFVWNYFAGMAMQGDILALYTVRSSSSDNLTLFSVANPFSPILLSQSNLGNSNSTFTIKYSGDYIYSINTGNPTSYIVITDVSDPYNPTTVSSTATTSRFVDQDFALFSKGTSTYLVTLEETSPNANVRVYDVTNPSAVTLTGTSANFANSLIGQDFATYCNGIFYFQGSTGQITLFDVYTNTAVPSLITTITPTLDGPMCATYDRLYVADFHNSPRKVYVYNVTTPATPTLLYSFDPNSSVLSKTPTAIWADGHFCYITTTAAINRLYIFDVKSSTAAVSAGTALSINNSFSPLNNGIFVNGNHVFIQNIGGAGSDQPILEIVGF